MKLSGPMAARRVIEERDDGEDHGLLKYTIVVPAIVCDACVNTIKTILSEFAVDGDIRGDAETKRITIAAKPDVQVETLLDAIKVVGYDDPLPFQFEGESKKRQKGSEHKAGVEADFDPNSIVGVHTAQPIVHQLRITTSRTTACLDGIVEKFRGLNLQSQHNDEGVVSVVADPSVTGEQLEKAIYSLTGHSASTMNVGKKFRSGKK